jgi:hypothetical protein
MNVAADQRTVVIRVKDDLVAVILSSDARCTAAPEIS